MMDLNSGIVAITPKMRLNELALFWQQNHSFNLGRLLLIEKLPNINPASSKEWRGSAIYRANSKLLFPDIVHEEVTIGNTDPRMGWSKAGFDYKGSNGDKIIGEVKDDKHIYFHWTLPKSSWSKNQSWRFAEGLRYAIAILTGKSIQLRYHDAERNDGKIKEFNIHGDTSSFGLIFRLFDEPIIDKDRALKLARFLCLDNEKSEICRRIFHQIEVASKQETQQATELLLASTLEAALRSIYHLPFSPGQTTRSDPFKLPNALKQFRLDYFNSDSKTKNQWKKVTNAVEEAYSRLRHRNAHPDWLSTEGGMLSKVKMEESVNDMILLSRFYGYMILGLSGFENLDPIFPAPVANWKPLITMETKMNTEILNLTTY